MNIAYLLIGSNKGERLLNISKSFVFMNTEIGTVTDVSPIYETEPWGFQSDTKFINIAVELKTKLDARDLLIKVKDYEKKMGRSKSTDRYEPRELDMDIIFFNHDIINEEGLIIPHPKMHKRMFVLDPLSKMIPDFKHPVLKKTVSTLLDECEDKCEIKNYDYK